MNLARKDGPLSLSLSPSEGERVPTAGEGRSVGSKHEPTRGILSQGTPR